MIILTLMEVRPDEIGAENDGKGKSSSWGGLAHGGSVGGDSGDRRLEEGSMMSL